MNVDYQRTADLGNGYYQNPILGGDYPDPSLLRVGEDYYMTHSSFTYGPGLLIWHSRDLVNWEPLCNAVTEYPGNIYAPDFIKHGDRYYIYYPADGTNWVITASSPEGPWSKPVNLHVNHIDPGHVVDKDGKRYLHLSGGCIVPLSDDGLSITGEIRTVYDGWQFPNDWAVEGFCLESPKLTYKDGYYYLTVAQGGTAGPATGHMVISSRSKTPWGPWEHSPYNPVVRAKSREDKWWSRGHGTLVDTPQGDWWIMYHAYEKDYLTLGRQTILEPIEWTKDGWFKVPKGISPEKPIRKPAGTAINSGLQISDSFTGTSLGLQWRFFGEYDAARYKLDGTGLTLQAKGISPSDSSPMLCIPVDHAYEISAVVTPDSAAEGGLVLYYNRQYYCGLSYAPGKIIIYGKGKRMVNNIPSFSSMYLRIVNNRHDVSLYYSLDGCSWTKLVFGMEVSGFQHNTLRGFLSLRAGLFACGAGNVKFQDFKYGTFLNYLPD